MKNLTKILAVLIGILTLAAGSPAVQGVVGGVVAAHPALSQVTVLIGLLAALLHQPSKQ